MEQDRSGKTDALPLAAGQLMGIAVEMIGAQTDLFEDLEYHTHPLTLASNLLDGERFHENIADMHAAVQRRIRVLKDHLHPAAHGAQLPWAELCDIRSVYCDRALGRVQKPDQRPPERGLAAARFTHKSIGFAPVEFQGNVVYRFDVADGLTGKAFDREICLDMFRF